MEDVIRKELCNFCENKSENCMRFELRKKGEIIQYKCLNYKYNYKGMPYEELEYIPKDAR